MLTEVVLPVAALLQVTIPVQPVAVRVAELPEQIVALLILTLGAEGVVLTIKLTEFDAILTQLFSVQVAV